MKLEAQEVNEIALESRLVLTDEELSKAVKYINNFLDMLDCFKELDLRDVEPFSFPEIIACPLRDDVSESFSNRQAIFDASEHVDGAYFKVPRIVEG